ncbi:hypothetical protein EUBHAL_00233 [Anaerobutyricum hallii DSM 3353]|uniref:Uncharacterized protein n=1 Tax=Anaerobutyricum hallii DSM 3353 TaxID=411469 RepID=C0ES64_9FIRM|nr:hypothetical protein EUBHAL_00233 [Anaerobutyricum hallii DSM 3353]
MLNEKLISGYAGENRVSRIHRLLSPPPIFSPCLIHFLQPQHRSHCHKYALLGVMASSVGS